MVTRETTCAWRAWHQFRVDFGGGPNRLIRFSVAASSGHSDGSVLAEYGRLTRLLTVQHPNRFRFTSTAHDCLVSSRFHGLSLVEGAWTSSLHCLDHARPPLRLRRRSVIAFERPVRDNHQPSQLLPISRRR